MEFLIRDLELPDISNLSKFKCGIESMDNYLVHEAYYNHICGEGRTKVVVNEDNNSIIAYYTLKSDSVEVFDKDMHYNSRYIPCIEVSRLAVISEWQYGKKGINLGTSLLGQIITVVKEKIAPKIGCHNITLHALPDKVNWYEERDFVIGVDERKGEEDDTVYMYLNITDPEMLNEYVNYKKSG